MRIPTVTTNDMREIDRVMVEEAHIGLIQMMENAGRNLAHLSRGRFLGGEPRGKQVLLLCGTGGNGGGGMVAARRLHCWGAQVTILLSAPASSFRGTPAHQLGILQWLRASITEMDLPPISEEIDLVLDALIGYGLRGSPSGWAAEMIMWANNQTAPILSLDVPSGLDPSSGIAPGVVIHAAATMTLALPKTGLDKPQAQEKIGEYYLADIGVPPAVLTPFAPLERSQSMFAQEEIIRLR